MKFWLAMMAIVFSAGAGWAEAKSEESVLPKILAIQKRPYLLKNEFDFHLSYLPEDNFTTYTAFGGTYTHYYTDYFGWEVVNANSARSSSTGLEEFVRSKGAVVEDFDVMNWYVTSNLIYTPMYMKNLFMKDKIIWGDISLAGGYGITNFKTAKNVNSFDAGILMRYFTSEKMAIKFDLRQFFYLGSGLRPNLSMTLGFAYNFNSFETPSAPVEDD